ncbi:MAG: sugar phosphate isomerase/epimerase family protein [Hydrogenoanaerobacterium sp.]
MVLVNQSVTHKVFGAGNVTSFDGKSSQQVGSCGVCISPCACNVKEPMAVEFDNQIIVNTNSYHGYSIEDAIKGISDAGFKYVELTATENWTEHIFRDQKFSRLCDVKDMLHDAGLTAIAMSGHTNLMDDARAADFIYNIKLAAFFDCQYIVSSIGEAHIEDHAVASNEVVAEKIKKFLPYLEQYNMMLVLEVHGDHNSAAILKEICDLTGSERVKINYDTANAIYWGGMNNEELLKDFEENIDSIQYIHIKDKLGAKNEWNFPALGKGYVPFEKIFEILKDKNKNCPLSIEIEFTSDGAENLEAVNKAIEESANYLKMKKFDVKRGIDR